MTERTNPRQSGPLNPLAVIVPVIILAAAVFVLTRRNNAAVEKTGDLASRATSRAAQKGRSTTRRAVLTVAINALENDALRRVVIMGLKLARSRS